MRSIVALIVFHLMVFMVFFVLLMLPNSTNKYAEEKH